MNYTTDLTRNVDNFTSSSLTMSNTTVEPIYDYLYPWSNETSLHSDCAWVLPIQQAILGVELILTLILNGTVILLIIRKGKQNKMAFFVLNLAISDFSMAIFYILPFFITRLVGQWYAGYGPCKMYMYLNQLAMYSSTYMLVFMSVDRVYAIAKPLSATRRGLTYRRLLVVSAWAVAACVAVKDLIYSDLMAFDNGVKLCETLYPEPLIKPFIMLEAVVNVFVPALIVTICYSWIVAVVSRRTKYAINAKQQKEAIAMFSKNILPGNGKTDGKRTDVVRRAKIRSTKVMFAVVSVFLICWSPHTINFLLTVYGVVDFTCTTFILFPLAPLNSMANPIVFLAFNYKTLFVHKRKGNDLNRTSMKTTFSTSTRNNTERSRDLLMPANLPPRDA